MAKINVISVNDREEFRRANKTMRPSRFSAAKDLIIARKLAAASAHLETFEECRKCFETAASNSNSNNVLIQKGT